MDDVMVNTFIRGAVKELKTIGKCYCYFEWQIEEITNKYVKKYGGNVRSTKISNYFLLKVV